MWRTPPYAEEICRERDSFKIYVKTSAGIEGCIQRSAFARFHSVLSVCIGAKDKLWLLNFPSKMPKWREDLIMQTRGRMDSRLRHGKSADMGGHSLWDTAFINLVVEQQFQKILSKLMNM